MPKVEKKQLTNTLRGGYIIFMKKIEHSKAAKE